MEVRNAETYLFRCDFGIGLVDFSAKDVPLFVRANRILLKESFGGVRKRLVQTLRPTPGLVRFCSFGSLRNSLMNSTPTYKWRMMQTAGTSLNAF